MNIKAFMRYDVKIFTFLPLHRHLDTITLKGGKVKEVGKAPIHLDWTKRQYNSANVRANCIAEKRNMGIRLTEEQMVIDVDPRNGGDQGFLMLCADLGIDDDEFPRVDTGSGGWHVYMSKPGDVLIRDTLDSLDYKGVEFKSKGRQVVAAGSIHPNGKPYTWSKAHPPIEDGLPPCPPNLLTMLKRPPRSSVVGGGQYSQDQIAKMLATLDATKYQDQHKWFSLMQACHHASAGEARSEFVEWSTSDPEFAKDADLIGRRWDSLHADRNDGVTFKTLLKEVHKAGGHAAVPRTNVADDFSDTEDDDADEGEFEGMPDEDDDAEIESFKGGKLEQPKKKKKKGEDDDGIPYEEPKGWPPETVARLEALNKQYLCLLEGGKFKIMYQEPDGNNEDRKVWVSVDRTSFETLLCNQSVERDMTGLSRNAQSTIPLGEAWIKWPKRRDVKGVVFRPDSPIGEADGWLNLWNGFETTPDKNGSWDWMKELLFEVIADGKQEINDYIINWLAYMIQKPGVPAEACVVMRGGMGTGKGTFGNQIVKLVGQHAMSIGSSNLLTGRFNSHMKDLIFLFSDEATNPYERAAEGTLRHLITEPFLTIERKGVDVTRVRNILHVLMASNDKWVVPAGKEERRFMVTDVSDKWSGDAKGGEKFEKLLAEMANGGLRRLMFDLMTRKLGSFHPRKIPFTKALIDQKIRSLEPLPSFILNCLTNRELPMTHEGTWEKGPVTILLSDFREAFSLHCRRNEIRAGSAGRSSNTLLQGEIRDSIKRATINVRAKVSAERTDLEVGSADGCAPAIILPDMWDCAQDFERANRYPEGYIYQGHDERAEDDFG